VLAVVLSVVLSASLAFAQNAGMGDAGVSDGVIEEDGAPSSADAQIPDDSTVQALPSAQFSHPAPAPDKDTWGIGGHPIIGYSPESRWTLGAGLALYYNPRPWDPDQRLDEYVLQTTYTTRKQGSVGLQGTTYLSGNRHFVEHRIKVTDTPSSFFGIGANTPDSAEESYTQTGVALQVAYQTMVRDGLYLGPDVDFIYSHLHDETPSGLLDQGAVLGSGTTRQIGVGFLATFDSTNSKWYKLRGSRVQVRGRGYHPWLGGSHAYWESSASFRHFVPLFWNMVLAFQLVACTANGDVPFYNLQPLGGDKLLRGYSAERYIAKHFLGGQVELRYRLFWRFGGTLFAGVAEVENRVRDFGRTPRAAAGIGWRFAINRSQTINLRFDLTYNSHGQVEKYIKLREAF
jgi:outer membrane protein assembly factor BamA